MHIVYSSSRKVFCHCCLWVPAEVRALSKAAKRVRNSTDSLSVNVTAEQKICCVSGLEVAESELLHHSVSRSESAVLKLA